MKRKKENDKLLFYKISRAVVRTYLKLFYKWKIYGVENIPDSGSVILISNHISNFDPVVVICSTDRQIHYMAKEELFKVPILGKLLSIYGTFPIKRGGNDRKAIKTGLEILKKGKVLGIFPEGTRSKTGVIGQGLPGAALFALKSDAIVIPIGIASTYKYFKPITINFGKPINLDTFKKEKISSDDLIDAINYMMEQIKKQVEEIK